MKGSSSRAIDEATRIAAGDDRTRYDAVAIGLHWATVVLVLLEFALAETWTGFARPTRHVMIVAHMSFGILLAAVIIARIVWRLIPGHQMRPAVSGVVELASKAVHYLLYAMLVARLCMQPWRLRTRSSGAPSWSGEGCMSPRLSQACEPGL